MPRVTLPEGPAVYWIEFVPWPAVMVPFVIVQVYVPPATAAVLALLFVLFAQTAAALVIAGEG